MSKEGQVMDEVIPTEEAEIFVESEGQTEQESQMTALQVLLSAKPIRQTAKLRIRKRAGLQGDLVLTLKSLTDSEFRRIGEQAERPSGASRQERRKAQSAKETDNNLFLRLIVSNGVLDPNLNDPKVLSAHNAISGDTIVQSIFLPGEVARIAEEIMALSGWDDDAVELETVKN